MVCGRNVMPNNRSRVIMGTYRACNFERVSHIGRSLRMWREKFPTSNFLQTKGRKKRMNEWTNKPPMIECFEEVMDNHKVRPHVWKFRPALSHDIDGLRGRRPFTYGWSNQWWWSFNFLQNFYIIINKMYSVAYLLKSPHPRGKLFKDTIVAFFR